MKNWKSAASGWTHNVAPENLDQTRGVHLLVMNGSQTVKFYVEGFDFSTE